jgi:hypothetical protein
VRFRRNRRDEDDEAALDDGAEARPVPRPRPDGPWDASEIELDEDREDLVDMGGLVIPAPTDLELQMQVDETSGAIVAVLLANLDGAVELRPFAAPRHGDIWEDTRRGIAAEVSQQGGTATEGEGPWGKELRVKMTVQTPDGSTVQQPSRVVGIAGPRWMLRATFFGKPALEPDPAGPLETALRSVVVVRGSEAMPPGDALPLHLPPNAQPVEPG